jgi:NAD+ synthase
LDPEKTTITLTNWIRTQISGSEGKGAVVGVSGGIDSAVVVVLCKRACPDTTLGINLPCYSDPVDQEHARLVAQKFNIPYRVIVLDGIYDSFLKILPSDKADPADDQLTRSNLKVRLRMVTLYYHANRLSYRVVGSSNRSELTVGYFTKFGDGAVDMMPLGNLVKQEVVDLAQYLGIPDVIIEKPPTAGLWPGQTDEDEMGITYKDLDRYILTGQADEKVKERIEQLHTRSQHKRELPPVAIIKTLNPEH